MAASFFFYDLETSGLNPRDARIMQFAGQRTDLDLKPIGEPFNILIKMTRDAIPDPDSVLITGITPQMTLADGVTEAEFLKIFHNEIVRPDTVFLGYNTVRFDDEFMRYLLYRNFYDPYEWQWCDSCSRWDILDMVRMTRALRPDGIVWPFTDEGKPTNRLELLTKLNGLDHEKAHDALNDVYATIAVAKLIRGKQPKLFNYLLDRRGKKNINQSIESGKPFMYASGRYPSETLQTTAAVYMAQFKDGVLVYDLRHDPTPFLGMSVDELVERARWNREPDAPPRLPVKKMKCNQCPAVVEGVVRDAAALERLQIDPIAVANNLQVLERHKADFTAKALQVYEILDVEWKQKLSMSINSKDADSQLYDNLPSKADKPVGQAIRAAKPVDMLNFADKLRDERLKKILPLYKARNYPNSLAAEERQEWEAFCRQRLMAGGQSSRLAKFFARLDELGELSKHGEKKFTSDQLYLLEELQLYGQSIMPVDEE